ncbi:MAG: aminotransferase class III-fold pyridoxal phosphate-dependent enzyme [Chloroflexi bacterium]|nr:aminotransferase class III-fold pyridoxal phosphate-dependent enzyme [Chloroflexota bacterium]MBA3739763.1 aminotransferase class III-fold pyridoxal phosphate-dependent enzyme [Chloroflexota bacterium]
MTTVEATPSGAAARNQGAPHIQTELPGPRARALIARDDAVASPSLTRAYPLVAESGSGCVVTDVDGNRFLDFAAGIAVCSTGHSHPKVVAAIKEQADRLIHIAATDFYEPRYLEFMERLAAIAPFKEKARVFLTNSGTEAVEGAIKLARYHTHRPGIIAFEGAFHGRTLGALSLTNSKIKQRAGFGPLIPMVHHAPFPRIRAWREGSGGDGSAELEVLRRSILGRIIAPSDVAAIVVEPIQGEGGYFPAPKAFMEGLRAICDEHGILLVADEIQSGMGRTGSWWAIEGMGVEPDILTTAKGIASGMPIGAFIARDSVWTWPPGAHGSTFAGNPVCAAAGLATLKIIESEGMSNAASMGARLRSGLERVAADVAAIRDVRGVGLMLGVEFDTHEAAEAVQDAAFQRGLLTLECGESSLRFSPPLIVDVASVDAAIRIFGEAVGAA